MVSRHPIISKKIHVDDEPGRVSAKGVKRNLLRYVWRTMHGV